MAKFKKRLKAHELRKNGWSIKSIAARLSVAKATVSVWCRDLALTEQQKAVLLKNAFEAGHRGRMMGAEMNKKKKEGRVNFWKQRGKEEIGLLSRRDIFIAGIALYWAEGSKKSKFAFVNSEPQLIKFMFNWLKEVGGVKKYEFMPRIFINEIHKPRIEKVLRFWSHFLRLPKQQFGNPTFLHRNPRKVYENYDNYYGVLALRVRKSAELKYRVLGLIEALGKINEPR